MAWPPVLGGAAMAVALFVLVAWWSGAWALTTPAEGWAPVRPNAALALLLAGAALAALRKRESPAQWLRHAGVVCALGAAALGLLTVIEYRAPLDLGVDALLVPHIAGSTGSAVLARMSEATAWSFTLLGVALACLALDVAIGAAQGMLAVVLVIQALGGIGYAYDGPSLGAVHPFVTVGLHTALLLFVLSVAALWVRPDRGFMRTATGSGSGPRTIRRMLPLLVVVLFGAGLLRAWGPRFGIYAPGRTESVIVVVVLAVLTGALWYNAELLGRAEVERDRFFMLGGDLFCIIGPGGRFARVNLAVTRALGWGTEELVDRPLIDFVHPDDRASVHRTLEALRAGQQAPPFDARVQMRDGQWRRVWWTATPGPRRRLIYASGRDVTDLHAAQEALRASEQNLAITLHSIGDGVITTDAAGRVTGLNPAAERVTGWTATEAWGRPVGDVFRIVFETTHEAAPVPVDDVLRTGAEAALTNHTVLVARDGTEHPIGDSAAPIRDAAGVLVGVVMVFRDISAERAAERTLLESNAELERRVEARTADLRNSERQFSDLFEFAPDGVVIVDAEGRITLVNREAERLFGWTRQEIVGQAVEMLVPEALRGGHVARRADYGDTAGPRALRHGAARLAATRKDGSEFPVEISLSPMQSPGGRLVVASVRDVTDRAALEAQFLQAQKMESIGALAGAVAHDFNNLLTVINSVSEMAAVGLREGDPLAEDLKTIRDTGWRAAELTRQLLAFSRRQVLQPRVVNLNTIVDDLMPMLGRLVGESIRLTFKPAADLGNTRVDRGQVEQVVMNLVVNARDAMPAGGTLTIETRNTELDETYVASHAGLAPGAFVLLTVTDTGSGMDAATARRMFEPFFTTKGVGKGTGLGLSTVYGIVKQSGGDIWVYSEPGVGTTFKVYFPRVLAAEERQAIRAPSRGAGGTETVLVVEDEATLRALTTRILGSAGYTVLTAADGAEALAVLERHRGQVHLLLTDLVMPGMGGRELSTRVAALHPGIKVIYTSGYADDSVLAQGPDAQSRFVAKPFSAAQLRDVVRGVLDA